MNAADVASARQAILAYLASAESLDQRSYRAISRSLGLERDELRPILARMEMDGLVYLYVTQQWAVTGKGRNRAGAST
jgi:predicted ArsR family transcriptional regulator